MNRLHLNRRTTAFTLIELLVVIAIISVLLGLLLSGVQSIREAAARTACSDRLRQLALGLHHYHSNHSALPPGHSWNGGRSEYPHLSWHARLLPYIEQPQLWDMTMRAFDADRHFGNVPPHGHQKEVVKLFICPTDPRVSEPAAFRERPPAALSSYLGIGGRNYSTNDGVLYSDSKVRLGDVLDGTSSTLMLGERPPSTDLRLGWWYAGIGQNNLGSTDMFMGVHEYNVHPRYPNCWQGPYLFGPGSFDNPCDAFHFWSPHSGGAHFAFADGSVRRLRYSASAILTSLSTRAGGETINSFDH